MTYLVRFPDGRFCGRGKPVERISNATIYPHPSAAKKMLANNPGSVLVPFAEVKAAWWSDRNECCQKLPNHS